MKHVDKLILWVCIFGAMPVIFYSLGHEHGYAKRLDTCPQESGKAVAYSERKGEKLQCVYVKYRKGLV